MDDNELHESFSATGRYKDSPTERLARELHEEGERGIPDGLYGVVTAKWAAGFVVERGKVTMCAPILRRRGVGYWMRHARFICD